MMKPRNFENAAYISTVRLCVLVSTEKLKREIFKNDDITRR